MNEYVMKFKALSDLTRIRALRMILLSEGPVCVCEISDALRLPQYQVSKHLAVLRQAGLVTDARVGTWVYYSVPEDACRFDRDLCLSVKDLVTGTVFEADETRLKERLAQREGGQAPVRIHET